MRLQIHVVPTGSPAAVKADFSFLEIASPTLTLEALCISISNRFERLYPHRPSLKIDKIQDSNGNDLDLGYLVSDVFSDKLEDNLNSIVRVLQKSTLRESSIPPESSLRPQFVRKRRRLGTVTEVNSNASQEPATSAHSSERGRIRDRFPKRPRMNDYVVQDSMDDREEGEEHWRQRSGHDNKSDDGRAGNEMVEVVATQQSGQLSPSLGNRTPSPEVAVTGTVKHPGQAPFIEVKEEDKEQAEEIQEIHYSSPYLPLEPGSADPDHHSSPTLPPNPTRNIDIVTNGIRRSIYDIPTSSSSEDEPSLPVSSQNTKKRRQSNGNPSQSPILRKKKAEEAQLAAEKAEKERAKEQAAAREKAAKAAEAREKAERERLAKEKAEAERQEKERKEAELQEQKRIAAEKLEKQRKEEERELKEKAEQEARIAAEKAEKEKLERERLENERLVKEKAEQERLAEEEREQERIAVEKAEQEKAEQERLEKERIEREKEEALNEKKERARKRKNARAAERRAQANKERAEKLEREKAEKLEREKAEKAEKLKREKAEKAEKAEKVEKIAREKAEKARKQAEFEENNRLAKVAKKQAKERAKGLELNSPSSGKELPSSQLLPQSSQVLMTDSESPVPIPNSTLKRSNLKTKLLEGSRKRSSVSFAEDLTEISSPTPTGKNTPAPVLGSKVTPILPPGYSAGKLIAEAVVMKAPAKSAAETESPAKTAKLAVLPPKPTAAKKVSPQPSPTPAQTSSQKQKVKEPAPKSKPSPEPDSEFERSADEDSRESGSEEEEEEQKPRSKSSVVKSTARVKNAKNASPLMALKPSTSTPTNSLTAPPSTQQSSQRRSSRSSPQLTKKTPIPVPATPAMETDSEPDSETGSEIDEEEEEEVEEEIASDSDSDFDPSPKSLPTTTSTKPSKPKPKPTTTTTKPSSPPQSYKSLTDLEKMPVPDVHDIHSSQVPLNPSSALPPPPSGTVRKTYNEDDDSTEESCESNETSDEEDEEDDEEAGRQVINSAKKAAATPAKRVGFLSNFWGRKE